MVSLLQTDWFVVVRFIARTVRCFWAIRVIRIVRDSDDKQRMHRLTVYATEDSVCAELLSISESLVRENVPKSDKILLVMNAPLC